MKRYTVFSLLVFVLACCLAVPLLSAGQAVANKQSVLSQAGQSYYNLRSEGVSTFECSVAPNWELLVQDLRKQDPEKADKTVKALSQLQFVAKMAADGEVTVTHSDLSDQKEATMTALKQIYTAIEQVTSGFFDNWTRFMLNSPFPEVAGEYQLEAAGSQYRLSYKKDVMDVVTTMGRDFAISNEKVTGSGFDRTLQPHFASSPKGFVLSAYELTYPSQEPEQASQFKVVLEYQEISGVQMPQKLDMKGSYGDEPFAVELTFSDCQVTKKQAAGN